MTLTNSEYTFPPTDGSVNPRLVIDFHLEHNPDHVFAVLYDTKTAALTDVTYEQLAYAVHRAAHILNPNALIPQKTNLGLLVSTNSIMYITLILGAMRAGLVPFPISPRTHVAGIAHLCTQTKTTRVLVGGSPAIVELGKALRSDLSKSQHAVDFVSLPTLDDLFPHLAQPNTDYRTSFEPFGSLEGTGDKSIILVLHSSGSTGMPRAISFHQEGVFKNIINQPLTFTYRKPGARFGVMALPTFHMMGIMMQCTIPLYAGFTQVLFAPSRMPVVPTSNLTMEAIIKTNCQSAVCVPTFLEMWSQDENAVAQLQKMDSVTFGGGPLAKHIGDKLADYGVRIHCLYGATEFGTVSGAYELNGDLYGWPYISFSPHADVQLDPQNNTEEGYEIVLLPCMGHAPFVLNSKYKGQPAYFTKDLVVQHPTKPELWKLIGRLDDLIVLLNGEKTNPGPMEAEVVKSPSVQCTVMFGRERNQTGILVELADNASGRYETKEGRAELVEEIWPYVEQANQTSPSHSRLAKDTIILVSPLRPLPRTPKSTVSRSAAIESHAQEIEDMYAALERGMVVSADIGIPESWKNKKQVQKWVGSCVQNILGRLVDVSGDFFQQGMDSLTATILLRAVKGALRSSSSEAVRTASENISQQTIFSKPTVEQLSGLLVELCADRRTISPAESHTSALEAIHGMIKKYNSTWDDKKRPLEVRPTLLKERVVVTGTTGALGSYLLAQLLENDQVEKVWALNRKSEVIEERQRSSFEDKMLDVTLLKSDKLSLLEANLEDAKLGLEDQIYEQIRGSATAIIHNAWQVNFNLSLQSFDPSIKGARNLLDLAFESSASSGLPRFLFTSSIAAAGFGDPGRCLKEGYLEPEDAAEGMGYGQSKLVTEKLLESARSAGLEACVIRLGQLTGDDVCGSWSITDWVPSIVASSLTLGCLPDATGDVSWLPLNIAARSILDVCTARKDLMPTVIHSSHPHPVKWSHIFNCFAEVLKSKAKIQNNQPLPVVPFKEWSNQVFLAASAFAGSDAEKYKRFPSTKIQSSIEGMVHADEELSTKETLGYVESGGIVRLDTTEAEKLSETLRSAPRLGREHVEKWVEYWSKSGLFV